MATPQYITDNTGKKLAVVLPMKDYTKMLEQLEDIEDVKTYDKAMSEKQEFIPLEQAIKEIEHSRKRKKNV
ncbi:MAG: hypothetical protein WCP65_01775 [Bacteroidota bacterium]